jgi:GDP-mannose 6-dehydrogenase
MVEVAQTLLGRGYKVRIYDPQLNLAQLVGTNKRLIDTKMPHLASLLHSDLAMAIGAEGLVVVSQRCAPLPDLAKCVTPKHSILDVNGWPELKGLPTSYEGFCW